MSDAVTFGDVEFDPTEPSDFRMSIEGASGSGKTNTLAVLLEDLQVSAIPMLVVDGVGSLASVRSVDDNILVIGAPGHESVNLAVPVDQLDVVADLVYDRGLKVLLAAHTYEDFDADESQEHRAVANALRALFSRARDRYLGAGRKKVLVAIDEAHEYAPEKGAEHITLDEQVRRSRSNIVRLSTKGGNYGINTILAYQRRAYIQKGALTQVDNWVVHQLEAGDRQTAAKDLNIEETEIENLETGEALVYGPITDRRVVGPTKVRKRTSPDPREETFEVPDTPPDVAAVVDDVQDSIEQEAEEKRHRQNRIEELEEELERKEQRIEDLQEEIASNNALERLMDRREREGSEVVDEELQEEVERLRDRRDELEAEVEDLESDLAESRQRYTDLSQETERLEDRVAELEALEEQIDEAESLLRSTLEALGRGDPDVDDARARVDELEAEVARLREENQHLREEGGSVEIAPEDMEYIEFVEKEAVQEAIAEAVEESHASKRYVQGVVTSIVDVGGPVSYSEIADRLQVTTKSNISKAASTLETKKVVTKEMKSGETHVDLNIGGLEEIIQAKKKAERTERLMDQLET